MELKGDKDKLNFIVLLLKLIYINNIFVLLNRNVFEWKSNDFEKCFA